MTISFGSNKLIESGSMASSFQSDVLNLVQKRGYAIHAIFTGSPVGSLYIAVSIDNSNWIVLDGSAQSISAAGDVFYNVDISHYISARLHYTRTSGTGDFNAFYSTKEVV